MHFARPTSASGLDSLNPNLDQGLHPHNDTRRTTPIPVGTRTITIPPSQESRDDSLVPSLLLSFSTVLQRERGTDGPFDSFTCGWSTDSVTEDVVPVASEAETETDGEGMLASPCSPGDRTVAWFLRNLSREAIPRVSRLVEGAMFFVNDGLVQGVKGKLDMSEMEKIVHWGFQLEFTQQGNTLTVQALRRDLPTKSGPSERQTVHRLDIFIDLLNTIFSTPETPVSSLLGPLPRDLTTIWDWNATVPPTIDQCIHELISEKVPLHAEKPAVSSWDGSFTYSEVESLSTRLAHHLVAQGVTLGTYVPLCFEKSRWTIVAVLGTMKAGGAFALTDPTSQPEGRLRVMVEQTGGSIVMASESQADLAGRITTSGGKVVVVSDKLFASLTETPMSHPLPEIPATTSPLYIQFTSGSTGKPKGVVISHANYTSGAIPRAAAVGYKASSRVFEFASYAFDVSIDCMLCTLAVGGTICIPSDADRMNDLGGAIRASGANMAHMTPSVARVLDPDVIAGLDVLGLGGEAVSAADAASWSKGKTSVIIAYGPSECTVGCTVNNTFAQKEGKRSFTTGNIGQGVGGLGWVVDPDDSNKLVPVGAVGELIIEGPVVGLGYLDEPEKTAEVFIGDPAWLVKGHGSHPGRHGRFYKTGDLVCYDDDMSGDYVFIGRKDAQVKLRGQRVELVEIEHHLHGLLPRGVKLAAEVIKPIGGQPTLVTFLVDESSDVSSAESSDGASEYSLAFSGQLAEALEGIDETLSIDLPRYMVPAAYIPLREMPSLVSGKIDRKKLREIGASMTREQVASTGRRERQTTGSIPESAMEVSLHAIWKSLLGFEGNISVLKSFFAVGGDSLRAMKLVSAARADGIALTVADVFRHPVLRDMAVAANKVSPKENQETAARVQPFGLLEAGWSADEARTEASRLCGVEVVKVEDVYPCTPLQEALMALSAKIKEAYVAQRVLKLESRDAAERLQAAFEAVAADCAILRTRIIHSERGLMQVVVKEPIQWRSAGSLAEYLDEDRNEQTDLGKPLVRYAMIHETDCPHFVLTMHHALYDGWSMPLIVDRVNQAYQGLALRRPAAEFKDFIHYLDYVLDRNACDEYWRNQLHGATGQQFPTLPFEGYQTQADSLFEIDISLGGRRLPSSSHSTITLATVVRAAWALVASQYCRGNSDMVFGETLTGRNAPIVGADGIEGPMITTVPVRVCIDRNVTVLEYLESIADQTIAQIPYEHAGLQHIRRLSDDALQACELRTGFVLHPATGEAVFDEGTPANGLVPAGDTEAAQEALKFNTYALMLVCSLSADGFFVMASFDSRTVSKQTMERALEQLRLAVHQLCDGGAAETKVGDVQCLIEDDRTELQTLSNELNPPSELGLPVDQIQSLWIVDAADHQRLVPRGAVGEIVVEACKALPEPATAIDKPRWFPNNHKKKTLFFKISRLGKFCLDTPGLQVVAPSPPPKQPNSAKISLAKPPSSATSNKQKTLRAIWALLLKVEEASIYLADSFFNRGGDSITAMKLVSELRQTGMQLTVAQVFAHRTLYDMASVMQPAPVASKQQQAMTAPVYSPFSALLLSLTSRVREHLADKSWKITDILPTRPLQEVAVRGTVEQPRFSIRYELMHFASNVDKTRLFRACQDLIERNEILRTVFVRLGGACLAVVLDHLGTLPLVEYETDDDDIESFTNQLCRLDAQTRMPYGSSFVKWFFVTNDKRSTLVFRLSHAQYDEICLPILLNQLHQLYQGAPEESIPPSFPFSSFVNHTLSQSIPHAIPYWRNLLAGSRGISLLRPDTPITNRRHFAIHHPVDISPRSRDVTVATLPSAAWALTLARKLATRDVVFGEVASGRGVDIAGIADANSIAGPCWQYIPTRVRFDESIRTGHDLLAALQDQHMASAPHSCMGLDEIVRSCIDWDPSEATWFDTVVHQDVAHVETLSFLDQTARFETIYPYEEPLREWKIQAFHANETLTIEVITYESWKRHAAVLLDEIVAALEQLVQRPWEELGV